jgi:acyl-CoA synthetase (AMP-forming)/AMP-acid ligase II
VSIPGFDHLDDVPDISDQLLSNAEEQVSPADPMVMIFTSGATAEPKAVVHTHGAQVRQSANLAELYGFSEGEDLRSFTNMPFFWVGGLTVLLLTHLHVGGTVITVERMDALEIVRLIERTNPTRVAGWTLMERLMGDPALAGRDLTWLVDLQPASMRFPGMRHNSLGMTETSGPHTAAPRPMSDEELTPAQLGSFGPPVPGVEHKIVDPETGDLLPPGVEGEICVRGYSLTAGLYKRERTETFDADGWYHTGDRGYFRDGLLFFTGRHSGMIKTGGANVSPREVEQVVAALPGVQAAFVVGLPDADRGEIVGCLVCPEPGSELDPDDVAEQLRDQLSSYKVPRRLRVIAFEDAPWLPSGKVSMPGVAAMLAEEP